MISHLQISVIKREMLNISLIPDIKAALRNILYRQ